MKPRVIEIFYLLAISQMSRAAFGVEFKKVPELKCPEEILVESDQKLKRTPKGWRKFIDKTNLRPLLSQVNFYSGAPESLAMLRPNDDGSVQLPQDKYEDWISCVYQGTSVQITRKIPKQFSTCRTVYTSKEEREKNALLGLLDSIECR